PGMFLGDVGSYLLGALVAGVVIASMAAGTHPVAALAPVSVYWADTVSTIARRAFRGEPVFEAHRTHAYQRLTTVGFSHFASGLVVAILTATAGAVGILTAASILSPWLSGLAVVLVAFGFLALPRTFGNKLPRESS